MLFPQIVKFRKRHRCKIQRLEVKPQSVILYYGTIGLKCLCFGLISSKQLEASIKIIKKNLQKQGKLFIKIFAFVPVTKKPVAVRMGKGKGKVLFWAACLKPGRVLFEIKGVSLSLAKKALAQGAVKLPLKTKIIGFEVKK